MNITGLKHTALFSLPGFLVVAMTIGLLDSTAASADSPTTRETSKSPAGKKSARAKSLDPTNIRFAVIGDFGSGGRDEADVAALIHSWQPDFIITTGDNRYGWTTSYDQVVGRFFCAFLKDAGSGRHCPGDRAQVNAFFPSLGNHDYTDGGGIGEYLAYFTLPGRDFASSSGNERYYDFVWGPVHFFVLNSNRQEPDGNQRDSVQARWLRKHLAASTTPWQVVYFHHAAYSSADHGPSKWMQWPFGSWGADAVISGHDHTYERLRVDGIPYFVNGLGGKSLYGFHDPLPQSVARYNDDYGAMRVDAAENRIRFRFINRQGILIDSITLQAPSTNRRIFKGIAERSHTEPLH